CPRGEYSNSIDYW
nr:immunoglobulin heavy chain junction region [Macaca mulatta]